MSVPGRAPAANSPAVAGGDAARVGRDGLLRLAFERVGGRTVVTRARFVLPLQVMAPVALPDRAAVVSVLNPTGGVVGGDRLDIDVDVGIGAHACLTTPSATRVYRTCGAPAAQHVRLTLARDAVAEWVPDHTIPFAGSAFRQRVDVSVGDGATLVLVDAFAAGRVARGESWRFTALESALTVVDRHGPVLVDRFVLRAPAAMDWDALGLSERAPYFAAIVLVADRGVTAFVDAVNALGDLRDVSVGAAVLPRRGALVRALARTAPALGDVVDTVWATARREALGLPPLALRKP